MRRAPAALALILASLALGLMACGGDEEELPPPEPPAAPPSAEPPEEERDAEGAEPPRVGDGRGGVATRELGSFESPVQAVEAPGSGDLYVVEQPGRVLRLSGREGEPETLLDLTDEVSFGGEQGLLSLAFHPRFERNGRLYVNYTDTAGTTRVVEHRSDDRGATIAAGSAREVLSIEQPLANHNGGLLLFDEEGRLVVATGDGGGAGDPERTALDRSSLLGKLLRIDPRPDERAGREYRIPPENPFTDDPGARDEILAYGLRNPWRLSFDRRTGDVWIGDVGQNAWEEVNGVTAAELEGANFGWSAFEGEERFNADQEAPDHVPPLHTYPLIEGRCAITGGYVVRDERLESLYGRYLYADFCHGELRSFTARPGGEARDDRALGLDFPSPSSFGEGADGRIYVVSLDGPVAELVPE